MISIEVLLFYLKSNTINMKNSLEAIVFDAYGTLFNVFSIDDILNEIIGTQGKELSQTWRKKQLEYTWLRSLMNKYKNFQKVTEEAFQFACLFHSLHIPENEYKRIMNNYLVLDTYEEVSGCLTDLTHDFRLGILSNANYEMLHSAAKHNSIEEFFHEIISVDEIGKYKPDPAVYQLLEKKFEVDQSKILFISSNTWDVSGASAYGLNTCWLNRFKNNYDQMGYEPDFEIKSLKELKQTIENSNMS